MNGRNQYENYLTLLSCSVILLKSGQARRGRAFQIPPGSKDSNGTEVPLGAAGRLSGYLYPLHFPSMSRFLKIIIPLALGIGLGLFYGWVVDPADFFDLTPDTLRADYKTDYVLMTAEAYHAQPDPGLAARRLAIFGSQSPSTIAAESLAYARTNGFDDADIALIQELVTAMQAWSGIQ